MEQLKRGDKIFLDPDKTKESAVNQFLDCRDGIVEVFEYVDENGYGSKTRLFLCRDTKHETVSVIRQIYALGGWLEEFMSFDAGDFVFLQALITGDTGGTSGKYTLVRDYGD